jgi:hypothetical protein
MVIYIWHSNLTLWDEECKEKGVSEFALLLGVLLNITCFFVILNLEVYF